ncbi:hypothetical protein B566_EDAN000813 [Ephemera danica]|nr:hypothetical protein B566_EDAN000813 [Ephemera danica]
MEGVIECFFTGVFTDLERDGLGARYKRRGISDYLSSLVGSGGDTATNCLHAVQSACRIHGEAKAANGTICPLGKFHNVLYIAVKLSFDWQLADSDINAELLNHIYSCERTFERLVIAAILGPRVTRILSGWQADFKDEEESLRALDFFLNHAVHKRLVYPVLGVESRMIDVPMPAYHDALPAHLACVMDRPVALMLLLRYGARVGAAEHGSWEVHHAPLALMQQLIRLGEAVMSESVISQTGLASVRLLLRALPNAPLPDEHLRECADALQLPFTPWSIPSPLKHLARCAVRRQLGRSWRLPGGVNDLPIPVTLVPYLDLQED